MNALALLCLTVACPAQEPLDDSPPPLFQAQSAFWINLHHFLYGEALTSRRDPEHASGLSGANAESWRTALALYRESWCTRDLLFDTELLAADWTLAQLAGDGDPLDVELPPDLGATLAAVAPLYREHFWREHDRANQAFWSSIEEVLEQHGRALAQRIATTYGAPWPAQPVRVDLLAYANWAGAYTSSGPAHVRIASADRRVETVAERIEVLFHEASHLVLGRRGPVVAAIVAASRELERPPPEDLWHAILFDTTGVLVREALELGAEFVPYVERVGLWRRGRWPAYREALAHAWRPYLAGERPLEASVRAVVRRVFELE